MGRLQQNAFDHSSQISYTLKAMEPHYVHALAIKRKTFLGNNRSSRAQRVDVLRQALTDHNQNVFKSIVDCVRADYDIKAASLKWRLERAMKEFSTSVERDITTSFSLLASAGNDGKSGDIAQSQRAGPSSRARERPGEAVESDTIKQLRFVRDKLTGRIQNDVDTCLAYLRDQEAQLSSY